MSFVLVVLFAALPLGQDELPTTDGSIAVGNLDAQIDALTKKVSDRSHSAAHLIGLISALQARGQYLARLSDYERAAELADRLVKEAPRDGRAWAARAGVRATFHRFADARADLARADALGGARTDELRASIAEATGHNDDALAYRRREAETHPDIDTLGQLAAALAAVGELDEARRRFDEAQHHYRDVSPFPVAWLYFQAALVEERAGRFASARALYEAAHARLPAYAAAAGHLAGLYAQSPEPSERPRALELLRPLVERSDDPEYWGQLAALLPAGDERAQLESLARRRFDELLRRHPEAFADHAARFYLTRDPKRALALAERNLKNRATSDSVQLVLEAAMAAHADGRACDLCERGLEVPHPTELLRFTAQLATARCGRPSPAPTATPRR